MLEWKPEYRKHVGDVTSEVPWTAWKIFGVIVAFLVLATGVVFVGSALGWFSAGVRVVTTEFGPEEMLRKYEWFKDAAAQIEKKKADIEVYENRIRSQDEAYKDVARKNWPRDEREQRSVWESEVAGVKASYNNLAADYNAQMTKFNWAFANIGTLPKGADSPLPREFKPYISK